MIPGMGGHREIVDGELVTVITYRDVDVYIRDVPMLKMEQEWSAGARTIHPMASPSVKWLLTQHALLKALTDDISELREWMFEESANVGVPLP